MALTKTLIDLFCRDLNAVKSELNAYKSEVNIWKTANGINNSAGNMVLHLIGNLNTYIGAEMGKTGYVRNRPLEFSDKDVPREKLLSMLDETMQVIQKVLADTKEEALQEEYPQLVLHERTSTEYFLVHLTTHLGYHLGQINYHRRLLDK